MLAQIGITEAQAHAHTPEWIEAALDAADMDFRVRQAAQIKNVFTGAAAAFNGGDAFEYMNDTLDALTSREDTPEHSSETDFAKLEAMGVARTFTAEEAALVH
jgi:hypothetical protein